MKDKKLIRAINEEISNFDFLNQEELQEENNMVDFLKSKEFQTRLIYDLMNRFNNNTIFKNKEVIEQSSNVEELEPDSSQRLNVTYVVDFNYDFNGRDLPLSIIIEADNIWQDLSVKHVTGDYDTEPSTNTILDFDWSDFRVKVMYDGETEVDLEWLYNNKPVFKTFLERFIGDLVSV